MSAVSPEFTTQTPEFEAKYVLSPEEVSELSYQLLAQRPPHGDERFVCYSLEGDDRFSNLGRHVETTVFDATFGNDEAVMREEYGPYDQASEFFLIMDTRKTQPVGVMRIIKNSEAGLKTLNDIEHKGPKVSVEEFKDFHHVESLENAWDVGTVALLPKYRSSHRHSDSLAIMLYRALYVKSRQDNIDHFVAAIDGKALTSLRMLGVPFVPINDSEPFSYLDSAKTTALYGYVPEFDEKMTSKYEYTKKNHKILAQALKRPLGRLMLGNDTDQALQFLPVNK